MHTFYVRETRTHYVQVRGVWGIPCVYSTPGCMSACGYKASFHASQQSLLSTPHLEYSFDDANTIYSCSFTLIGYFPVALNVSCDIP